LPGGDIEMGDINKPSSISVAGQTYRKEVTIAAAGNAVLYNDELSGFEVLGIQSDFTVRIALEDTAGTPNTFSLTSRGSGVSGTYGPVTPLWSDDTVDASTRIDKVTIYNDYAGVEIRVLLIAVK
jgi:hypothetical protein